MNETVKNAAHANQSFRFVQLSDLHLSSIEQVNPLQLLNKRILGYLSWRRKRRFTHRQWIIDAAIEEIKKLNVDHYAITGDFTHIGLKSEFQQVSEWLQSITSPKNMTIIPGNHDLYVNSIWKHSFHLWEPYLIGDNTDRETELSFSNNALKQLNNLYPIVRIRKNTVLIGVSSVFAAPWFRATGFVAEQQLEKLRLVLSSEHLKPYCKILLIHHPITLTHTPKRKSLINYTQLNSLLKELPVHLILHGHGHSTCVDSISCNQNTETPIIGMASSSSTSLLENYKAEFLLFDVTQKDTCWNIEKQNFTLDHENKQFVLTQKQVFNTAIS